MHINSFQVTYIVKLHYNDFNIIVFILNVMNFNHVMAGVNRSLFMQNKTYQVTDKI